MGTGEFDRGSRGGLRVEPDVIVEIWERRKWVGILVASAVLACVTSVALSLPDVYRATAKVLVDRQEVSEAFVRPSVTAELETRIQTIHQQVLSRARLGDLITRLGLYPELVAAAPLDAVVERMRRDIELRLEGVETSGRNATIAFTLSYTGGNRRTVAEVANMLVAFYIDENARSRERQSARTADFLGKQVAGVRRQLDDQERRTGDFMERHTDELPQQLEANVGALDRLNSRLQLNGEFQLRNLERRERIAKELADAGLASAAASSEGGPEAQLWKLRQQLAALRLKYSDRYPDVIRLNTEISVLEAQVARTETPPQMPPGTARPAEGLQPFADVDAQLRSLKKEEASLKRAIEEYEARVERTPARQREIDQLSRGHETTSDSYRALMKQYEDARIAASLEQRQGGEEFRILDPAIPPYRPTAPNRLWLALMGCLSALVFGVAGIVVAERLDTTFHAAEDLTDFVDAPILATIPRVYTVTAARHRRQQLTLMAGVAVVALALIVAGSWYVAAGNEAVARLTARGGA